MSTQSSLAHPYVQSPYLETISNLLIDLFDGPSSHCIFLDSSFIIYLYTCIITYNIAPTVQLKRLDIIGVKGYIKDTWKQRLTINM
jgi:hypothetical protein